MELESFFISEAKIENMYCRFEERVGFSLKTKHYSFKGGARVKLIISEVLESQKRTDLDDVVVLDVDQVFTRSIVELGQEFDAMPPGRPKTTPRASR